MIGSKLGDLFGRKRPTSPALSSTRWAPSRWCSPRASPRSSSSGRSSAASALRSTPRDAVAHPRQLRRKDAGQGLRDDRRRRRHRGGDRPLIGGALTTLLSWRVGFAIEAVVIGGVLFGSGLIREEPFTGDRSVDSWDRCSPSSRCRSWCLGSSCGRRAASGSASFSPRGRLRRCARLVAPPPQARRQGPAFRPGPVQGQALQLRDPPERPSERRAGRPPHRAAHLPPARSRIQRPGGGPFARPALADDVLRRGARGQDGLGAGAPRASSGRGSRFSAWAFSP